MEPPQLASTIEVEVEHPRHEAQQRRSLSRVNLFQLNRPRSGPRNPMPPIYPPLPTWVPDRPVPSIQNPYLPWFGDLIHRQSQVLYQMLWRGRLADDGPVLLFELMHEGNNFDGMWGQGAMACHLTDDSIGFHQWIYRQPQELPMDQR